DDTGDHVALVFASARTKRTSRDSRSFSVFRVRSRDPQRLARERTPPPFYRLRLFSLSQFLATYLSMIARPCLSVFFRASRAAWQQIGVGPSLVPQNRIVARSVIGEAVTASINSTTPPQ